MIRAIRRRLFQSESTRRQNVANRRRAFSLKPLIEGLEDRVVLSTITWNSTTAPSGGNWDSTSNWVGGVIPTASNDVVINLPSSGAFSIALGSDAARSLTTSGPATLKLTGATLSLGTGSSAFSSSVEVTSGVTLKVLTGANVFISNGQTIAVDSGGSLTVGAATVTLDDYWNDNNGNTYGITVAGTLTATGSTFPETRPNRGTISGITALNGGHIIASNTTFGWDNFSLNNGSILNAGDLANDTFQTTVYTPGIDIPLLAGPTLVANKSFQDVRIIGGTLNSGQSLTLGLMGSASTANLVYVIPSSYEVGSGAKLTVANDVRVYIWNGQTIAVDAGGSLTVGAATVTLDDYWNDNNGKTYGITVAGTLTATGTTFNETRPNRGTISGITALNGGHIIASNTTFGWDNFSLNNGSILNSGDLANDTFQTTVYTPGIDIPLLAGPTFVANKSFQDVRIIGGTLNNGQSLTLGLMGSASTANLVYVISSSYEVGSGARLTVANDVRVYIWNGQTIAVDAGGSLTVGAATVTLDDYWNDNNGNTYGITVAGTLTATGSTFPETRPNRGTISGITALNGGHIIASNTTFGWDNFSLNNGSILNSGDLANDTFQTTVYTPGIDIPLLAGPTLVANKSFQDVRIIGGTLNSGQSLTLGLMGSASTANLVYVIPSSYEVKSGAKLTVADNARVYIYNGQTIAVDAGGSLTVGAATVTLDDYWNDNNGNTYGITVAGTLTATGTTFNETRPNRGTISGITALNGGRIIASNSSFGWDTFNLNNGSILAPGDLTNNIFQTTVYAPGIDIPLLAGPTLSGNKSFQNVNIIGGTLNSGQSLSLGLMGSASTANLWYVFPSGYEVMSGGALSVANNVRVYINNGQTIAVDAGGSLTVEAATVTLDNYWNDNNGKTYGITVAGTLTATGSTFSETRPNRGTISGITLLNGGRVTASNSTFGWDNLVLSAGSIDKFSFDAFPTQLTVNSGASIGSGITGNDFSSPISHVYATGDPSKTINLSSNFWSATPATKITDHANDPNRPTVNAATPLSAPLTAGQGTMTSASASTVVYNAAVQTITLSAAVTRLNSGPAISEGTVTFTILNGAKNVRSPVTVSVANGVASTDVTIPGRLAGGSYTVLAIYNGTVNFIGSIDSSHTLVVTPATTTTLASTATTSVAAGQSALLSAVVTSPNGVVLSGSETFTILKGTTVIGKSVKGNVVNGVVSVSYPIPVGTAPGSYTISAVYNGSPSFQASSADTTQSLTVSTASAAVNAVGTTATFNANSQVITLTANLTPGAINEGNVTFTIMSGNIPIGSPVTVSVSNGVATTSNYILPAGTPAGAYTIQAVYNGTANYGGSIDKTQHLTLNAASSQAAASNATAAATQTVMLSANVTSPAGTVSEGTVTFTVLNGTTVIGKVVSAGVVSGVATAAFLVPAGTLPVPYTIKATYNGTTNFSASVDTSHSLTVVAASATTTTLTSGGINLVFNPTSAQPLNLTATVASSFGTVSEGTVTFQIKQGSAVIVAAVTVPVVNGTASTTGYTLPAGTAAGNYVISAVYSDVGIFLGSSDVSRKIVVSAASTTVTTASATASVSPLAQSVSLSATVASGPMSVGEGIVTFTIYSSDGLTKVGQSVQGTVVNGVATVSYTLPASLAAGTYIIQAVYTDPTGNYGSFTDTSKRLVLS